MVGNTFSTRWAICSCWLLIQTEIESHQLAVECAQSASLDRRELFLYSTFPLTNHMVNARLATLSRCCPSLPPPPPHPPALSSPCPPQTSPIIHSAHLNFHYGSTYRAGFFPKLYQPNNYQWWYHTPWIFCSLLIFVQRSIFESCCYAEGSEWLPSVLYHHGFLGIKLAPPISMF